MSKIEEMDHKIGRHEGTVVKTCALCRPDVAAANIARRWWDHDGARPSMPRFGDLWRESPLAPVMVFVNPDPVRPQRDSRPAASGGMWLDIRGGFETSGDSTKPLFITPSTGAQMEMTEGNVNIRAEWIAVKNYIPAESGRSSPLGVDIVSWARDQNYAKLVAMMQREYLFPICSVSHEMTDSAADLRSEVRSACLVIRLNDLRSNSDQIERMIPF